MVVKADLEEVVSVLVGNVEPRQRIGTGVTLVAFWTGYLVASGEQCVYRVVENVSRFLVPCHSVSGFLGRVGLTPDCNAKLIHPDRFSKFFVLNNVNGFFFYINPPHTKGLLVIDLHLFGNLWLARIVVHTEKTIP